MRPSCVSSHTWDSLHHLSTRPKCFFSDCVLWKKWSSQNLIAWKPVSGDILFEPRVSLALPLRCQLSLANKDIFVFVVSTVEERILPQNSGRSWIHPLHKGRMGFSAFCEKVKKPSTFISAGMHQQAPLPPDTKTRAAVPTLPSPQALPKYYIPPRLNGVRVLPYLTLQSEILSAFHEAHLLWNSPSSPLCLSLQQMRSCWRVHPWVPSPCCYTCQMAATAQ